MRGRFQQLRRQLTYWYYTATHKSQWRRANLQLRGSNGIQHHNTVGCKPVLLPPFTAAAEAETQHIAWKFLRRSRGIDLLSSSHQAEMSESVNVWQFLLNIFLYLKSFWYSSSTQNFMTACLHAKHRWQNYTFAKMTISWLKPISNGSIARAWNRMMCADLLSAAFQMNYETDKKYIKYITDKIYNRYFTIYCL